MLSLVRKEKDLNSKNVNWEEVLRVINKHKVLPIIYEDLMQIVPQEYKILYKSALNSAVARQRKLWNLYVDISLEAQKEGIKLVLPKGFPVAYELYGSIDARPSADIDLLVQKKDVMKLCNIMTKLGCFHRHNGEMKVVVNQFNSGEYDNFYELKYIKFDHGDFLWVEIKKATDAIPEKHIIDFIDTARKVNIEGQYVWGLDDVYMFIHLCANAHKDTEGHEGICTDVFRLRNFVDLYLFLMKKGDKMDWGEVKQLSNKYEAAHKVRWALLCLGEIFPTVKENPIYSNALKFFNMKDESYIYWGNEKGETVSWTESFIDRFFNNQLAKENYYELAIQRRWSSLNPYYAYPTIVNQERKWQRLREGLSCSFTYQNNRLILALRSDQLIKNVLNKDRLYFSFIGKSTTDRVTIDSIGNPSRGIVFFISSGILKAKVGESCIWTVNYGSYRNDQIENAFEILGNQESGAYIYTTEIDISDLLVDRNMIAYDIWIDGPVLDDYYRHKWYRYNLDQDIGILKIERR